MSALVESHPLDLGYLLYKRLHCLVLSHIVQPVHDQSRLSDLVDYINDIRSDSVWTWHNVPAGLSKLKHPLSVGGSMYARLVRDGRIIVELDASCPRGVEAEFVFEEKPETCNFNAYVAMAPDAAEF